MEQKPFDKLRNAVSNLLKLLLPGMVMVTVQIRRARRVLSTPRRRRRRLDNKRILLALGLSRSMSTAFPLLLLIRRRPGATNAMKGSAIGTLASRCPTAHWRIRTCLLLEIRA
jgi:hypothetical protein